MTSKTKHFHDPGDEMEDTSAELPIVTSPDEPEGDTVAENEL